MMRKKTTMKKTAAKKKPMYGKGTAKTKTKKAGAKPAAKMSTNRKQREAAKLQGRGIPERVVKQMLGTMGTGGMSPADVLKKYGYGGTSPSRRKKSMTRKKK